MRGGGGTLSDMTALSQIRSRDVRIGKRGTIVIPADIRHELGLDEGDVMALTVGEDGAMRLESVSSDPIERLRQAFGGIFAGIDPVEYQRSMRDEDDE